MRLASCHFDLPSASRAPLPFLFLVKGPSLLMMNCVSFAWQGSPRGPVCWPQVHLLLAQWPLERVEVRVSTSTLKPAPVTSRFGEQGAPGLPCLILLPLPLLPPLRVLQMHFIFSPAHPLTHRISGQRSPPNPSPLPIHLNLLPDFHKRFGSTLDPLVNS